MKRGLERVWRGVRGFEVPARGASRGGMVLLLCCLLMPLMLPVAPGGGQAYGRAGHSRAELRVGLSPDVPPLAFRRGERVEGLEVDLAHLLGSEMGRSTRLVQYEWRELVPALLAGDVDILMAGLSVTPARKVRMAFSQPYLEIRQRALIRRSDAERLGSAEQLMRADIRMGVLKDSTGDSLVQQQSPQARKVVYAMPEDAVWDLGPKRRRIDAFIYDGPAIAWYASEHEADLVSVDIPSDPEAIAWGLRPDDEHLLEQVNAALDRMRRDGRLERLVHRWMP